MADHRTRHYYTSASGGLVFSLPACIGIALSERDSGRNRPVIAVIGEGSFQYSVQSIWNAAQLRLPMLIAVQRTTSARPGHRLDRERYTCDAARVQDLETVKKSVAEAWAKDVPTVLEVSRARWSRRSSST